MEPGSRKITKKEHKGRIHESAGKRDTGAERGKKLNLCKQREKMQLVSSAGINHVIQSYQVTTFAITAI